MVASKSEIRSRVTRGRCSSPRASMILSLAACSLLLPMLAAAQVCLIDDPAGTSCGSGEARECSAPDTCDGAGTCLPNDAAVGTPCGEPGDTCSEGGFCVAPNTLIVNTTQDGVDANPGDGECATALGLCSLRAAVQEANASSGPDLILLLPDPNEIRLTIPPLTADDTDAASGDLDVTENLVIRSLGGQQRTIDADGLDRVFEVVSSQIGTTLEISDVRIQGGAGVEKGGGVFNSGTLILERCAVSGNHADTGATPQGGGIYNNGGTVALLDTTIADNQAAEGGGIFAHSLAGGFGTMQLISSTLSGNTATLEGGGILNERDLALMNSTLSGNSAAMGGGIFNKSNGTLSLHHVTFSGNTATAGGYSLWNEGEVEIENTILANGGGANCGGDLLDSFGSNLSDDFSCELSLSHPADLLAGTDAALGPLAENFGPTQTHAPSLTSAVIDAVSCTGTCPANDQRGLPRPVDPCDCDPGAVEVVDDSDNDGLDDVDEVGIYGTDPILADTDGDGLGDGDEVNRGTDPLDTDSDGDGLKDGDEVNTFGTNPLSSDTDNDGVDDPVEVVTGTSPTNPDTDGDGIPDGTEDANGNGQVDAGETDPRDRDTDGDGLEDNEEDPNLNGQVDAGETNAAEADTDGDGSNDLADNCPLYTNATQEDLVGVGSAVPNDTGDVCQCGDLVAPAGLVDPNDVLTYRINLADPNAANLSPEARARCAVTQGTEGLDECSLLDWVITARAVAGLGPGIGDACRSLFCFEDLDADEFGTSHIISSSEPSCDGIGVAAVSTDCDDGEPTTFPGAFETPADGTDSDCDTFELCYVDNDVDDFGSAATITSSVEANCVGIPGLANNPDDCDDNEGSVNPAQIEVCGNSLDDNCNVTQNERNAEGCVTWYRDNDADGYGAPGTGECWCSAVGTLNERDALDCYDFSSSVNPAAGWHSSAHSVVGWDWNCNGVQNKRYTKTGGGCNALCSVTTGWRGSVPACGKTSSWTLSCTFVFPVSCRESFETNRRQQCR